MKTYKILVKQVKKLTRKSSKWELFLLSLWMIPIWILALAMAINKMAEALAKLAEAISMLLGAIGYAI